MIIIEDDLGEIWQNDKICGYLYKDKISYWGDNPVFLKASELRKQGNVTRHVKDWKWQIDNYAN